MDHPSIYDALPVQPWQTRLLQVEPRTGAEDNNIVAELVVVDIVALDGAVLHKAQRHVDFRALSYTWGLEPFSDRILLNKKPFAVKPNLYKFLQQYRASIRPDGKEYIWIDAVCINQSNPDEKSVQVANMLTIYEKCSEVLVWLGTEGEHTSAAISAIQHSRGDALDSTALEGLHDIYSRDWYRRIWVKQEIYAARSVSVWCGVYQLPWPQLIDGTALLRQENPAVLGTSDVPASKTHIQVLGSLQPKTVPVGIKFAYDNAYGGSSRKPVTAIQSDDEDDYDGTGLHKSDVLLTPSKEILSLIMESTDCESTDLRDRIYALLGMSTDQSFSINYNDSASEVFTSLARYAVRREGTVSFLFEADATFGACEDIPDLPSWVPEWRTFRSSNIFNGMNLNRIRQFMVESAERSFTDWCGASETDCRSVAGFINDIAEKVYKLQFDFFEDQNPKNIRLHGIRVLENAKGNASCWRQLIDKSNAIAMEMLELLTQVMSEHLAMFEHDGPRNLSMSTALRKLIVGKLTDVENISTALHTLTKNKPKIIRKLKKDDIVCNKANLRWLEAGLKQDHLVEAESQRGDILVLCFGCRSPILLRPSHQSGYFSLVKPVRQGRDDVWSTMWHGTVNYADGILSLLHLLLTLKTFKGQIEMFNVV